MKRIAVIGMGRSGTSFITQFLSECGVYVDEVGDKFEHTLTRQINDAILDQAPTCSRSRPRPHS